MGGASQAEKGLLGQTHRHGVGCGAGLTLTGNARVLRGQSRRGLVKLMTKEAGWPERRRGHAAGALGSDRPPLTAAHQRSPWPLGVRLGAGRPCRLPQPGDGVGPLRCRG